MSAELATLTTLPFASLELLPLLLEAGQYNVALRVALAAYEMRVSVVQQGRVCGAYWACCSVARRPGSL